MSMNYSDMSEKQLKAMRELFGEEMVVADKNTALLNQFDEKLKSKVEEAEKELGHELGLEANNIGDIKTMSDGTQYRVTSEGWRKI